MSFRRTPNPNRNHPIYCPYCAGEDLYPNEETDFAWKCHECLRIADVRFYGQDDPDSPHAPTPSTAEALQRSLAHHGHSAVLRREANGPSHPTLITLSHGSRHPEAVVGAREITAAAGHALGVDALAAHLEFTQPDLTGVARALVDKHTTRAVVVPLLFTQAYHAKVDVPTAIADAAAATGIELSLAGGLGQGRDVAEVLAQRVRADAHPNATVALYPVGTTHPDAAAATEALGAHVGETTGQRTVVVPATGKGEGRGEAGLRALADDVRATGSGTLHLLPLFVSHGTLLDMAVACLRQIKDETGIAVGYSGPLLTDVAPIVAARYTLTELNR
ncbi:sirohydrochlorin chelatase [Corynebacterium cystitidis]|uniref:sirohydrochlorin chelatase n=1 Tax=Corynebacterium cystitidis TaxID=35757 RepID=UPI002810AA6B|nr:CbiX/SirB N-terminal domain-containing protein [Corynebacterium cystitidis]